MQTGHDTPASFYSSPSEALQAPREEFLYQDVYVVVVAADQVRRLREQLEISRVQWCPLISAREQLGGVLPGLARI